MTNYLKGEPTAIDQTVMKPFVVLVPNFIKPNHITFFRLIFIPLVIYLLLMENYLLGGFWFIFLGLTDALDGALARLRDEVTNLGKFFDPLADKLLVVFVGAIMITQFLNLWIFTALLLVEIFIVSRAWLIYLRNNYNIQVQANTPGKIKMVFQVIGISFLFVGAVFGGTWAISAGFWALSVAILFAVLSLTDYHAV